MLLICASILSLAVLGGFVAVSFFVPFYAVPLMDPYGGYQLGFPSDIIGGKPGRGFMQAMVVFDNSRPMIGSKNWRDQPAAR